MLSFEIFKSYNITQNFYLHIPFCRQKCGYCKFALTPIFDDVKKRRYLKYLKKEIREYFSIIPQGAPELIQTIYFGGGTPSVLSIQELQEVFECFPSSLQNPEITLECNPEDITKDYIEGMLALGVNRISLGVQSLNEATLSTIHRSDTESIFMSLDAIGAVIARKDDKVVGISEIEKIGISLNVDFILGLPFSRIGETLRNIKILHKKYPFITHTSVYMLEEGLYPKGWKKESISESSMESEYSEICEYFHSIGWKHYEISNWAQPGYECKHNLGYWDHTNYRGFGLSATSYTDGMRYENSASFTGYYSGKLASLETLTESEIDLEKTIHQLRTFSLKNDGFNQKIIDSFKCDGLIELRENTIFLTPAGIFRENFILSELIH